MPDYSFGSLSGREFEQLVRDLLQAELRVTLESFPAGKDGGTDVRWVDSAGATQLQVQCKQYEASGYKALVRALAREAPRVKKRGGKRYIVATSLSLTAANKDEIKKLFHPVCKTASDVIGRDDLNNLLGLHQRVEVQHFKLWLTSSAVLSRIVNAGVFGASAATLEKARRRAQRYVYNESFERALNILEDKRICVIAGIPGIGKTTLAEVLLTRYVDRHDYQALRVVSNLAELNATRDTKVRQIFYYDDFLGATGVDLAKNEDRQLSDLMEEVASKPNWRLILTTREYILEAARAKYESVAHAPIDIFKCTIRLEDYTVRVRAEILYNHLFFSDMSVALKRELLAKGRYRTIYGHANYSPRIIEHMTSALHIQSIAPKKYVKEFISNLENPVRIWKHAFDSALSRAARHLLLARATLPSRVRLEECREAFLAFHNYRRQRFGFDSDPNDFLSALKALDGTFLRTERAGSDIHILLHNPSVQDFLEQHLRDSPEDVRDLVNTAQYFEQLEILWRDGDSLGMSRLLSDTEPKPLEAILGNAEAFGAAVERTLLTGGCSLSLAMQLTPSEKWYLGAPRLDRRVLIAIEMFGELGEPVKRSAGAVLVAVAEKIRNGSINRSNALEVLKRATSYDEAAATPLFESVQRRVVGNISSVAEAEIFARFAAEYPSAVSSDDRSAALSAFESCYAIDVASALDTTNPDDAGWVAELASDLEAAGAFYEVDVFEDVQALQSHAADLEGPDQDYDEIRSGSGADASSDGAPDGEIDEMFERLADDITE